MSSRVMIIKNCEECPRSGLGFLKPRRVCLEMFRDDGSECECPEEGTPDWCPLPGIPKKFDIHKQFGEASQEAESMGISKERWFGYMGGWNDCLEEIKGEEER